MTKLLGILIYCAFCLGYTLLIGLSTMFTVLEFKSDHYFRFGVCLAVAAFYLISFAEFIIKF